MNWEQCIASLGKVIKTDTMATNDRYFMATHMPFSQLEVIRGGLETGYKTVEHEDDIFDTLVANPDNVHRLVIVRGNNGTGKSHLIRYFQAKFKGGPLSVYNPEKEELVFLRRLNNSVRGVFSQLLEQNVIRNPEVIQKLEKFIASSEAKGEDEFKTDILLAFIGAVVSDKTSTVYKPKICGNIAQFLSDNRMQEHLLRMDGAIDRCYRMITTPSDQVLKDTTIFTEEDFNQRKLVRSIKSHSNPDAEDFAETLLTDDTEYQKLADYLNQFVPQVIQKCADISSESTKVVFEDLRRDLKNQGKNLTLFIEDFTGFTGIASELITVLSTEHGGDYEYLCRVTAIIGITDGYYDQFKDNFKDRVTHQINVTEESYGRGDFLVQMSARYLNAIYCDPAIMEAWNPSNHENLPMCNFTTPTAWESVEMEGKVFPLYPFNRKSITTLYNKLAIKSPRMFLRDVLGAQLREYFDGQEYGTEWKFPLATHMSTSVQMENSPHSSAIDHIDAMSHDDKQRLKRVLAIWGDGSGQSIKGTDGIITVGGIPKMFLEDIALGAFEGIGAMLDTAPVSVKQEVVVAFAPVSTATISQPVKEPEIEKPPVAAAPVLDRKALKEQKDFQTRKADINGWYADGADLHYHADYRGWLKLFLCGTNNVVGAINWQDIGIPAYIATERLSNTNVIYVDGQSDGAFSDKILIYLTRDAETRDALMALCEYNYAGDWNFSGGLFYQQKLITWLERHREAIQDKVMGSHSPSVSMDVTKWCLALQYLKALIFGYEIDMTSSFTIAKALMKPIPTDQKIIRITPEWNDLIIFSKGKEVEFKSAYDLLRKSSNTIMGAIAQAKSNSKPIYRTSELMIAIEDMMASNWDIETLLPTASTSNLLTSPAVLLKSLYGRIRKIVQAEQSRVDELKVGIAVQTGDMKQQTLMILFSGIQKFLRELGLNGAFVKQELVAKYQGAPLDMTNTIIAQSEQLEQATTLAPIPALEVYTKNVSYQLYVFYKDLLELERIAVKEKKTAETNLKTIKDVVETDSVAQVALTCLETLCDRLESMEVQDATE